jgi:uncharacterized membrane protein
MNPAGPFLWYSPPLPVIAASPSPQPPSSAGPPAADGSESRDAPAPAPAPGAPRRPGRVPVIDWLRGVAVITMIIAHVYDSWMDPALRTGAIWEVIRHTSGIPSRLFLFLVGVSSAAVFENQLAKGMSTAEMRRRTLRRGLGMLVMAYAFRVQEHILAGFWGGWQQVFRVDILNCIAASILLLALVGVPRAGQPRFWLPLSTAAILVALGPIVGPAYFPDFIPRFLSSYIGGQRPMSWFPLFPWGAWALLGLVVGQLWLAQSRAPDGGRRCFVITGAAGAVAVITVSVVRAINPEVIRYPSDVVAQMGPGSFFFRLGVIGLLALTGWLATRWLDRHRPGRFSVLNQLGRTSLLVYWVHVEIVYGFGTKPIHKQLSLPVTTLAFFVLTAAMLALSVWKTRHWAGVVARVKQRLGRPAAASRPRTGGDS